MTPPLTSFVSTDAFTPSAKPPEERPRWLQVDRLPGELHIPKDSVAGREELEKHLEWRRVQEDGDELEKI